MIKGSDDQRMRPTAIFFACALGLFFATPADAQENAAGKKHDVSNGNLHFEFTHSLRIPDYHVTVDLYEYPGRNIDSIEVRAISEPIPGHGYEETMRDSTFWISKAEYEQLVKAVNSIKLPEARSLDVSAVGTDGVTCVIEYGDFQNTVAITVWSPSDESGPVGYYAACKLLLKSGGFDPHKIFDL